MDSGRLMVGSAAPFRAAAAGGQVLLFGSGGGFCGGGGQMQAVEKNGRRKRPFLTAHELELAGMDMDDVEQQLCGYEYELHGGAPEVRTTKRRLTAEQVRALELSFEEEKLRLEPERKSELARRLGIAPRQVAVWFQNRRARWRAKQLEQDVGRLRAAHDDLLAGRDALIADNDRLRSQVTTLTEKLQGKEPPALQPEEQQTTPSAATDTAASMQAAVLFFQLHEDQLHETIGCAVPAQGFAGRPNSESPESYFAGAPSPPSSSEGDCSEEGSALLFPDAMLLAAVEHGRGHAEEDSWEWFWN